MDSVDENGITSKESSRSYFNIYFILVVLFILLFTRFSFAKNNCESISGEAAGYSEYLYEFAEIKDNTQLYFYSAPAYECRLSTFIVKGDKIEVLRRSIAYTNSGYSKENAFIYIRYRDKNGLFATGWITSDKLHFLKTTLPISHACEEWAYKNMGYRAYTASEKNNKYIVNERNNHAYFYAMPNDICRNSSVFLIKGDVVSVQEKSEDGFIEAIYYTKDNHIIRGWIKKENLNPLNESDIYRDDINTLSTDKAMRVATLDLRKDNRCIFYDSWNDTDKISIIVREDHQTKECRGGADLLVSPAIGYIYINKKTGEIEFKNPGD